MGDKVIKITDRFCGRDYHEIREYQKDNIFFKYIFVTRAYNENLVEELKDIREGRTNPPKILLMNSFLWDLTRWGPLKEDEYKQNMVKLFKDIKQSLPSDTLVVWLSTLPIATERVKGGVFIQQVEFVKHSMRFWILEGNKFAQQLCEAFGFNILDLHYHMRHELHRRATDGIHWDPAAVRYMTNIILTHIGLNLDEPLPGNFSSTTLDRLKEMCDTAEEPKEILLGKDVLDMIAENGEEKETTDGDTYTGSNINKGARVTKKASRKSKKKGNAAAAATNVSHSQGRHEQARKKQKLEDDGMAHVSIDEPFCRFPNSNQTNNPHYSTARYDLSGRLGHPSSVHQNNLTNQNVLQAFGSRISWDMINPDVFSRLGQPQGRFYNNAFQSSRNQLSGLCQIGNEYHSSLNNAAGYTHMNDAHQFSRNQDFNFPQHQDHLNPNTIIGTGIENRSLWQHFPVNTPYWDGF
ncbi:uncharacterized protein [Palaemon carinicauda]